MGWEMGSAKNDRFLFVCCEFKTDSEKKRRKKRRNWRCTMSKFPETALEGFHPIMIFTVDCMGVPYQEWIIHGGSGLVD